MPALAFLAVAGLVLTALLIVADDKLEKSSSPAIVTSQHTGLPDPPHHDTTNILTETPAPAPDMNSEAVLAAQPKSEPDQKSDADHRSAPDYKSEADHKSEAEHKSEPQRHATIPAEARSARAEASPRKRPVMPEPIQQSHEQNNFFDRFSIKGQ